MTRHDLLDLLSGELIDDDTELSLGELCRVCRVSAERVLELVDEGLLDPLGREPARWRFRGASVGRVSCAQRLERDLGVNIAGAALAIDLLEEMRRLRVRLERRQD